MKGARKSDIAIAANPATVGEWRTKVLVHRVEDKNARARARASTKREIVNFNQSNSVDRSGYLNIWGRVYESDFIQKREEGGDTREAARFQLDEQISLQSAEGYEVAKEGETRFIWEINDKQYHEFQGHETFKGVQHREQTAVLAGVNMKRSLDNPNGGNSNKLGKGVGK